MNERPIIVLDNEFYAAFVAALDSPLKPNDRLRKLIPAPIYQEGKVKMIPLVLYLRKLLPAPIGSRGWLARLLPLVLALSPLLAFGGDSGHFYRSGFGHNWEWGKNLALAENLPPEHNLRPPHPEPDGTPTDFAAMSNREYALIVAGAPAARSKFDVYVHEGKLSYVKEPCEEGDTRDPFFLHVLPADENDLPEWSRPHGYENRDFDFGEHGAVFDGKCLATVPLPEYDIDSVRTGQYVPGEGQSWRAAFGAAYNREYALIVAGTPAARSEFDVYEHEGKLSYVKEPCREGDPRDPFFLHVLPADENDLPEWSRPHGYENRDFDFGEHGAVFDGKCLATVPLPEYDIDSVRTGQYVPGEGQSWRVDFGAVYNREYALIVAGTPTARSEFDIYEHEGKLSYVKEPCREGDPRDPFFLHVLPAEENDLPDWSRPHGYENRDFDFGEHGAVFDGKCLATVPLPEYDIDGVRTGQYVPGEGQSWRVAFGAAYNREYALIVAGTPTARSEFDVYEHEGKLSYVKEPCEEGDTRDPFFLHVLPADEDDLPDWSRPHGFEGRDFDFGEHGTAFDGKCLVTVALPEYDIDGVRTGQYVPGEGQSWRAAFGAAYNREYALIVAGTPTARSKFDVYEHEGKLSYAKEPCEEGDTRDPFFLHVLPADENDLPEGSRPHGFESRDFDFGEHGAVLDGKCLATVPLPEYDIDGVRTGQYVPSEGRSWQVDNGISLGSHLKLILKAILYRVGLA